MSVLLCFVVWLLCIRFGHRDVVGRRGSSFQFHFDNSHASTWHAQLAGRKRWFICDANGTEPLHDFRITLGNGEQSTFSSLDNFAQPLEPAVMALLADGRCEVVVLEPGEVLFYPTQFWQCVSLASCTPVQRHCFSSGLIENESFQKQQISASLSATTALRVLQSDGEPLS